MSKDGTPSKKRDFREFVAIFVPVNNPESMPTLDQLLFALLLLVNILTFALYGLDKGFAKKGKGRISEKTLLTFAAFGGGIGAYLGMSIFHHKTMHKKFTITVPILVLLQIALVVLYILWRKGIV